MTYGNIMSFASISRLWIRRTALEMVSTAVVLIDIWILPMFFVSTVNRSMPFSFWCSGPATTCLML